MKVKKLIEKLKGKEDMEFIIRTPECRGYRNVGVNIARTSDDNGAESVCMIDLV